MKSASFLIDQKPFTTSVDPTGGQSSFKIKSIPRHYEVLYDETPDPTVLVNQRLKSGPNQLLVIDEKVQRLYPRISHPAEKTLQIPATEEFKTVEGMLRIVDFMSRNQVTKAENLVIVGGGITQDVGAFASAIYKRGIPFVYFPTTLLSQCDSCIGGKTGLNHQGAKNQLAMFSAPAQVVINSHFLKTLAPQEIKSGLGEILKLHIIGGSEFLNHYQKSVPTGPDVEVAAMKKLILGALAVKKVVIEEDEFELGLRRSMNYGHTFGHAIEILSGYRIPHGQAVTIGMIIANDLSFKRGFLPQAERDELKKAALQIIDSEFIEIMRTLKVEGLLELLKKDKKTSGTQVNFIVVHRIGDLRGLPVQLGEQLVREVTEIVHEAFHEAYR